MGAFELEPFAAGTRAVAEAVAAAAGTTVVGGGDSRRGAARSSACRPRHAPLDRRRRVARAARGQAAPGRGGAGADGRPSDPAHRGQLEDAQDDRGGRGLRRRRSCRGSSTADGVDVAVCPPFTALQRGRRLRARLARARCTRRTCTRSRGRVHGRGLGADAHRARRRTASCSATPSAASYFGETDRALAAQGARRARRPGSSPILCVGETEEERERGETERKLRHQVQEDLGSVPRRRGSPTSSIAYEPIWAIGTGRWPRPSRRRRRSRSSARSSATATGDQAERTRILYGGSVKPENAAELLALPDVDGALVGGASLDADGFARDRRRRRAEAAAERPRPSRRPPDRARRLGARAARARATRSRWRARRSSTSSGRAYPHTQLDRLRSRGRPAGGPDGQLGGRPPQPRRGRRRASRTSRASTRRSRTGAGRERRCCATRSPAPQRVHLIGLVSDGGVHSGSATSGADRAGRRARRRGSGRARLHRRPRHAAARPARRYLATSTAGARRAGDARIGTVVGRYFAMDRDRRWDRIQQAYDLLVHGRGAAHGRDGVRGRREPPTSAARPTSSSSRRWSATEARIRAGRQRDRLQLPPRPDAPDHPRAGRAGLRRGRPRRRRRRGALRHDDRVRGGLALPGRLPAGAPGRSRSPQRARRARAAASCTWPRPRSTRT